MPANWKDRTLWTGDNLPIMRGLNSESVDLIYLDPPFNSKANYAAPIGSKAAGAEFKDTWTLTDIKGEWRCCMIQLRREWGRFSNFSFRTPQRRISAYPARPSG